MLQPSIFRHFLKLPMFFSSILSLAHFPRLFETRRLKAAAKQKTSWCLGNVSAAATFDIWGISCGRSAPSFYCSLRWSRRLRFRLDYSAPTSTTHTDIRWSCFTSRTWITRPTDNGCVPSRNLVYIFRYDATGHCLPIIYFSSMRHIYQTFLCHRPVPSRLFCSTSAYLHTVPNAMVWYGKCRFI